MKIKILKSMIFLVSIIGMSFMFNQNEVLASTHGALVQTKEEGVYYTRRGAGIPYSSYNYYKYDMNGKVVFCIEPGVDVKTFDYVGEGGFVNSPYDDVTNKAIELIGHYGYTYPGHNTLKFRMATQALIWERVSGQIIEFWTEQYGNGNNININYEKNAIMNLVNSHYNLPSIDNAELNLSLGETKTITDTNNILSQFEIYKAKGADVSINGNTMTITPTEVGKIEIQLTRKHYDDVTTIVFTNHDIRTQIMGLFRFKDPVIANVKLNVVGGEVHLDKLDSNTQTSIAQGEATLEGAVYGIYDLSGNLIKELRTDKESNASSGKVLDLGSYYLQEITPSTGYLLDTNKYYFDITNENLNPTIKVFEKIIKRDVEINKFYANGETGMLKPEVGIIFEVYNNKGELVTEFVTDKDGHSKANLVYGTYTVKQKNTTAGHELVKDFTIAINNDSPSIIKYSLSNAPITAKLKLEKVDSESGKVIAYAGVEFKIKDLATGEYVCQEVSYPSKEEICIFKTNDKGEFTTPYPLQAGTYQLEEISSPSGYLLSGNHVIFTIDENSKLLEDNFGKYLEVIFKNDKIKGHLTITKKGETPDFKDNKIKYEEINLKGVVFGVYANEDIITLDGVKHYSKGDLITKLTTDEKGTAILENLILGKYYIQEISTLNNYLVDDKKYEFELIEVDNKTSVVYETISLTNKYKKGTLEFTKTDFVTGDVIPNTIIEIYNSDDKLLFTKTTDEFGKVIIEELPTGKYYIKEYEASTGYLITEEIVEFEIKENGEIVKAKMTNKPVTGTLEFTKVDFSTSEALPNTIIEIYDNKDELIYTGTTDENGMIIIEKLRYGKYYILEKEAPEGYILNTERMYFEILENGEIVKATMTNEKVIIEVPDTGINELPLLEISSGVLMVSGLGVIVYGYKKSKTKKKK